MFNLQKHSQADFGGAVMDAAGDERASIDNPTEAPVSTEAIEEGLENPEQEALYAELKDAELVRQLEVLSNDSVQGAMAQRILTRIRDNQRMGSYPDRYDEAGRTGLENRADEMGRPDLADMSLKDKATFDAGQQIQREIERLTRYDAQGAGMANAGAIASFNLKNHKTAQTLDESRFPVSNAGDFIEKYVDDLLAFNNEPGTSDYERARIAFEEIKGSVSPGFEEEVNSALESIVQLDPISERDKASQSLIKVYDILLPPALKDQVQVEPEMMEQTQLPMSGQPMSGQPMMEPGMMAESRSREKLGQRKPIWDQVQISRYINKSLKKGWTEETIHSVLLNQGLSQLEIQHLIENVAKDRKNWTPVKEYRNQLEPTMSGKTPEGIVKFNLSNHILNNTSSKVPMTKTAADQFGQQYLLYGPTEKRVCPKLRGKNMSVGDVVSEYICRHHCIDGLVIDDNKTICGEALWRANAMDKFSREYVDADGEIKGGYLNNRFEINRNVDDENKMRLKPGETRKPRPASQGNMEARLQDMRSKEGESRGYRPDVNTGEGFDWCHDQDQNNVQVSQEERDRREKAVGHQSIQYTNKGEQENTSQNKTASQSICGRCGEKFDGIGYECSSCKEDEKKSFNLKGFKVASTPRVKTSPGARPDTNQTIHSRDSFTPEVNITMTDAIKPSDATKVIPEGQPIKHMPKPDKKRKSRKSAFNLNSFKVAKEKGVTYKGEHFEVNPWAACNKSTGGKSKDEAKFERCVQHVKDQKRDKEMESEASSKKKS